MRSRIAPHQTVEDISRYRRENLTSQRRKNSQRARIASDVAQ